MYQGDHSPGNGIDISREEVEYLVANTEGLKVDEVWGEVSPTYSINYK